MSVGLIDAHSSNGEVERAAQGAARTMAPSLVEAWPLLPEEVRRAVQVFTQRYSSTQSPVAAAR